MGSGGNMQTREKAPNVKREGWNVGKVSEEASNEEPDEMLRKTLRGNKGNNQGNEHDLVGSVDSGETPQGREESKKSEGAKNQNG